MKEKLTWYLKQLLPFSYETFYRQDDKLYFERWRMWFGFCFSKERVKVQRCQCGKLPERRTLGDDKVTITSLSCPCIGIVVVSGDDAMQVVKGWNHKVHWRNIL